MVEMQVTPDLKVMARKLGEQHGKTPVVLSRALNRAISNVKTNMARQAAARYAVKQKDVKPTLTVKKARATDLAAEARSTAKEMLPLYRFKVSPKKPTPRNPPSLYLARVLKSGGLKKLSGGAGTSKGFVATMRSGHEGIFEREGRKRLPIFELSGPAVPSMVGQKANAAFIQKEGERVLRERVKHEISRMLEVAN